MDDDGPFRDDLARHPAANFDRLDLDPSEKMDVRFAVDDHILGDEAPGNLADVIDRRGADAVHVTAHLSFNERGAAGDGRAAQVAFRRDVDLALRLDRAAEARGDLVIPQVNVRAASRAKCRGRRGTDFVLRLAIKALDLGAVMLVPQAFDFLKERRIGGRGSRSFHTLLFRPQLDLDLRRRRGSEMRAALAAHRALGRGILHLLKATVRAIHTDFCRRRLSHGSWSRKIICQRAPKAALAGAGSSFRTISGLVAVGLLAPPALVTSDLPTKVAPSSITRRAAFRSP